METTTIMQGAYWIRNLQTRKFLTSRPMEQQKRYLDSRAQYPAHQLLKDYSQVWLIEPHSTRVGYLIRSAATGLVIDVEGGSQDDGASIITYSQHGGDNQRWYLEDNRNLGSVLYYYIVSSRANRVLDHTSNENEPLCLWTRNSGEHQLWALEPVIRPPVYWISNHCSGQYLKHDVQAESGIRLAPKGPLTDPSKSQLWILESGAQINTDEDSYVIRSLEDPKNVLDLAGGFTNDGTRILAYRYHGGQNQCWKITLTELVRHTRLSVKVESFSAQLAIEARVLGSTEEVVAGNYTPWDEQSWYLEPYPLPPLFWTTMENFQTEALLMQSESNLAPFTLRQNTQDHSHDWRFIPHPDRPHHFSIINRGTGKVLSCTRDSNSVWMEENSLRHEASNLWALEQKENGIAIVNTLNSGTIDHYGNVTAIRADGNNGAGNPYHQWILGPLTHDYMVEEPGTEILFNTTDAPGQRDLNGPYHPGRADARGRSRKKALILRFGTGTDGGIFMVKEMLVNCLEFREEDVKMLYFDYDPRTGPKRCTLGQDPPTVKNFQDEFRQLCKDAKAGDVRFLYVDTHSTHTPYQDGGFPGERDGRNEGWILAENDNGTSKGVVDDDWLRDTIQENLDRNVSLTIVTSSCMGGGMLGDGRRGILLAGCHETQFNVKALRGTGGYIDPWISAITATVKKAVNSKRPKAVPTYWDLFNVAKSLIRKQRDGGQLRDRYKGPSPNESTPLPMNVGQLTNTSHQDPQLIFNPGYIDPRQSIFLAPLRVLAR